jgi:NAD(P)-dependent dehydrogenase (short-subunit alcohol dehydrogenase family)
MLPMMKNSPAGRIVIIGFNRSVFAKDAADGYARSEASIAELTRNLAAEIAQYGINANYIQLGAIMTPESRRVFNATKIFATIVFNAQRRSDWVNRWILLKLCCFSQMTIQFL